jgi:hypothetical protein
VDDLRANSLPVPTLAGDISVEEKERAILRVTESSRFQKAPKLREFLRYVCEVALGSNKTAIREQDIGRVVYRRPEDYRTAEDNIVRVEARNLRKKLEEYYRTEGMDDPIVIEMPKGAYVPQFHRREQRPSPSHDLPPAPRGPALGWLYKIGLGVIVVLAGVSLLLAIQNRALRARADSLSARMSPEPPWNVLFDEQHVTIIALPDSNFVLAQDLISRRLTLADYLAPGFSAGKIAADHGIRPATIPDSIALRQLTSLAGAQIACRIMQVPGVSNRNVSIVSARNLQVRDLKGSNVILIGSVRSNPWVELFEPKLNFRFEYDFSLRRAMVRNTSPRADERAVYMAGGEDGRSSDIYSVAAVVSNPTRDGHVMMLSGTEMEGTESVAEFLLNPRLVSRMIADLKLWKDNRPQSFEILFKSSRMTGTSMGATVVSHRVLPD